MTSTSFDFSDLDPVVDSVSSSAALPSSSATGELLNFEQFVEGSPPTSNTGGGRCNYER